MLKAETLRTLVPKIIQHNFTLQPVQKREQIVVGFESLEIPLEIGHRFH